MPPLNPHGLRLHEQGVGVPAFSVEQRFWSKVERRGPDECWPWKASKDVCGYGYFGRMRAHRAAFKFANRIDPARKFVCHSCDNPACCNPQHLWLGTHADNMRDMAAKGRAATQRRHGEANPRAKLSLDQARRILTDTRPLSEIAAEYGVSKTTVCAVRTGQNWAATIRGE